MESGPYPDEPLVKVVGAALKELTIHDHQAAQTEMGRAGNEMYKRWLSVWCTSLASAIAMFAMGMSIYGVWPTAMAITAVAAGLLAIGSLFYRRVHLDPPGEFVYHLVLAKYYLAIGASRRVIWALYHLQTSETILRYQLPIYLSQGSVGARQPVRNHCELAADHLAKLQEQLALPTESSEKGVIEELDKILPIAVRGLYGQLPQVSEMSAQTVRRSQLRSRVPFAIFTALLAISCFVPLALGMPTNLVIPVAIAGTLLILKSVSSLLFPEEAVSLPQQFTDFLSAGRNLKN